MKRSIRFIGLAFIVTALFGFQQSPVQDRKDLSLKESIGLALKNSKQLRYSQAKIEEASASLREATDRRLPDFSITGSYLHINNPNIDLKTNKDSAGNGSGGNNNFKVSQAAYGLASISLPIYSGSRIQYGIESARWLEKAAKLDVDNDKEAVIINTVNAFINLLKAKAAVNLVQESLQQSRQRVTDFSNLEKNGLLARNDLLKVQLQNSNTELSLLDAQSNWRLANINMDLLLGIPETTQLIPDSSSFMATGELKTIPDYEQMAIQNRKDVEALSFRKHAAGSDIRSAKAAYYPSISLTGGYIALYVPNFVTVTNALNFGVGVQYSLSSLWKTKSKVQIAKAREQELLASEEMLNDRVRLQVNQAYESYLVSQKKIEVLAEAVEQAVENYRITNNKYKNSLATITDLLDADIAQLQARLNYTFAKADQVVAYHQLLQSAGILGDAIQNK